MKFDKYELYGAYHWKWYQTRPEYIEKVNFLKWWVREENTIDIGAGDGLVTYVLGIKGMDNEPSAIETAKLKGVHIDLEDALHTSYKDGQFESALLNDVIEHVDDPVGVIKESRRIITKYLYINMPTKERFNEKYHLHKWTFVDFELMIRSCGFRWIAGPLVMPGNTTYFKFMKI